MSACKLLLLGSHWGLACIPCLPQRSAAGAGVRSVCSSPTQLSSRSSHLRLPSRRSRRLRSRWGGRRGRSCRRSRHRRRRLLARRCRRLHRGPKQSRLWRVQERRGGDQMEQAGRGKHTRGRRGGAVTHHAVLCCAWAAGGQAGGVPHHRPHRLHRLPGRQAPKRCRLQGH